MNTKRQHTKVAQHLATTGLLDAFAHQVRLVRGRFGSYEPIDFLALLFGYAISGGRTLSAFFARVIPFGPAFMALFGRADLPHRATLSRFLASVDHPCLEAFRALSKSFLGRDGKWNAGFASFSLPQTCPPLRGLPKREVFPYYEHNHLCHKEGGFSDVGIHRQLVYC